ncbi:hypothetical protein M408DRAFT_218812 [Serendipita vermifera MAFF 305830]|uniref:Carbohydrate-binding module family 35 protein n=1 Tax=Serendipita vermifera MAFF 305830 TaxID=933852 RepID=A0A0C3BK26_SERVB|nr:hypothetical protein M408DRAFT_218812 [Serendipita vermifera MAFF 305830]
MRLKYGSFVAHFLFLFAFLCSAIGMTIVDDVSDLLVYSTSGPAWWAANYHNGQGRYVNGLSYNQPGVLAHGFTWHETVGDGASVSLTFTGTRVNLTGTVCRIGWPTVVDFYIDGQYMSRFEHQPDVITNLSTSDTYLLYPMANFGNLEPARHTFRAVSVGAGTLFAVDFLAYEPRSTTSASSTTSSTSRSITSSLSSTSSSFTASRSTESHPAGDSQPVVATMDVPASDSRIVYSPPDTWDTYSNARRATSCLEGTVSSSTAGSYLTYNFTGTNIQVYTVSSPIGGNYSISIDGQDGGIYSSYDPSTDPSLCSSRPLYSTMGLSDAQHTLVLTVLDAAPGSTQDTVQFVGFRYVSRPAIYHLVLFKS